MTTARSARQIVDDAYASLLQRGDMDAFLRDFDDESVLVEVESLPYGGRHRGKENIRKAMLQLLSVWKDLSYTMEGVVDSADCVISYGQFQATGAKSGKRVSFPLAEVWKVRDGRVRELLAIYGDTQQVVQALA
jgi:ketosteroid isomerase-like protein